MERKCKPLTVNQKQMLRKRGIDHKNFRLLKELNYALFLIDIRDNTVKIVDRQN